MTPPGRAGVLLTLPCENPGGPQPRRQATGANGLRGPREHQASPNTENYTLGLADYGQRYASGLYGHRMSCQTASDGIDGWKKIDGGDPGSAGCMWH